MGRFLSDGQSFALQALSDLDVSLSQLDVSGTLFSGVRLQNKTIKGIDGSRTVLTRMNFDNSDLTGSNFDRAILYDVTMKRLRYGLPRNFRYARLVNTTITSVQPNGDFAIGPMDFASAILIRGRLTNIGAIANFKDTCLVGVQFVPEVKHGPLGEADFRNAKIYGGSFRGLDLSLVSFQDAQFLTASAFFDEADHHLGWPKDQPVPPSPCFDNKPFGELFSYWADQTIVDAVLPRDQAVMSDDDAVNWLANGFPEPDFTDATLDRTNLEGANISQAKGLTQAMVDQACVDERTTLPPGLTLPKRRCGPEDRFSPREIFDVLDWAETQTHAPSR